MRKQDPPLLRYVYPYALTSEEEDAELRRLEWLLQLDPWPAE